jgi:hypothetical protein
MKINDSVPWLSRLFSGSRKWSSGCNPTVVQGWTKWHYGKDTSSSPASYPSTEPPYSSIIGAVTENPFKDAGLVKTLQLQTRWKDIARTLHIHYIRNEMDCCTVNHGLSLILQVSILYRIDLFLGNDREINNKTTAVDMQRHRDKMIYQGRFWATVSNTFPHQQTRTQQ